MAKARSYDSRSSHHCLIWALVCILLSPLPLQLPEGGLGKAAEDAQGFGPLPPAWETWTRGSLRQQGPTLTVAAIWKMNQQMEDLSSFSLLSLSGTLIFKINKYFSNIKTNKVAKLVCIMSTGPRHKLVVCMQAYALDAVLGSLAAYSWLSWVSAEGSDLC